MTDDPLRAYAIAVAEKRRLDTLTKANDSLIKELEPEVLQHFESEGVTQVKIKSDPSLPAADTTIYLRTEHWPSKSEACDLLSASELQKLFQDGGLGEFCEPRMNVQGLRAHFGEQLKQEQERARAERRNAMEIEPESVIPVPLRGVIEFRTVHKVGARKA
ncbi:MAG: hypothetical protein WA210_00825 [Burkholderiaceae bacterium]